MLKIEIKKIRIIDNIDSPKLLANGPDEEKIKLFSIFISGSKSPLTEMDSYDSSALLDDIRTAIEQHSRMEDLPKVRSRIESLLHKFEKKTIDVDSSMKSFNKISAEAVKKCARLITRRINIIPINSIANDLIIDVSSPYFVDKDNQWFLIMIAVHSEKDANIIRKRARKLIDSEGFKSFSEEMAVRKDDNNGLNFSKTVTISKHITDSFVKDLRNYDDRLIGVFYLQSGDGKTNEDQRVVDGMSVYYNIIPETSEEEDTDD